MPTLCPNFYLISNPEHPLKKYNHHIAQVAVLSLCGKEVRPFRKEMGFALAELINYPSEYLLLDQLETKSSLNHYDPMGGL